MVGLKRGDEAEEATLERSVGWDVELRWLCARLPGVGGRRMPRRAIDELLAPIEAAGGTIDGQTIMRAVLTIFRSQKLTQPRGVAAPDEEILPLVALLPKEGVAIIYGRSGDGSWLYDSPRGRGSLAEWPTGVAYFPIQAAPPEPKLFAAREFFDAVFREDRSWITQSVIASLVGSILALATSFYSIQVYDRVIGQGGTSTLIVLTVGVTVSIFIELCVKLARMIIVEHATSRMDERLSHGVFRRVMKARLDQLPGDVGTLAAQVRGYETVRAHQTALAVFLSVDAPFAVFFLAFIFILAGPIVAIVPTVFLILSLASGLYFRRRIEESAATGTTVGNRRQGLLVEALTGVESVKAHASGWQMQSRWNELSRKTIQEGVEVQRLSEISGAIAGSLQQIAYVGLVASGAWIAATEATITVGAIIACSILSGRVLAPVSQVPGLIVRWAHAQIALRNLERLFSYEADNHGVENPLVPDVLHGHLALRDTTFAYARQPEPLDIKELDIRPGEKVAILGAVGSGKSTLLRLLAGLVRPSSGQVLIDSIDVHQITRERLVETVGYLPQRSQLFAGTLRDNLIGGLGVIPDGDLLAAAEATGLREIVASRPEGLDLMISEAGGGLSGGQQQLVALTRLLLASPRVWLLDEPTASMDDTTEARCLMALKQRIGPDHTLVLVTHKLRLLELVDRIIIMGPRGVLADGPRESILRQIMKTPQQQGAASGEGAPEQGAA